MATQSDILPAYVLASGENTTGCFDIHTPIKSVEDYFIASNHILQRLVATVARYDGNCRLCGFALDLQSYSVVQHGHAASLVSLVILSDGIQAVPLVGNLQPI